MRTEISVFRDTPARQFGRKGIAAAIGAEPRSKLVDDIRLFALTFAGGFLFVSLYLA